MDAPPRTVVVCDDHTVFADSLAGVLPLHGFTVVAVTASPESCAAALHRHSPDLCLLCCPLPGADAITALTGIVRDHPATRVVVLGADSGARAAAAAVHAGAACYVHKSGSLRALTAALERAVAGGVAIDPPPPRKSPDPHSPHRLAAHLTPRERQCLALLVDGAGTQAIRVHLGVSATTVRTHIQALMTKLGVHSRLEAASLAVRYNLLAEDSHPHRNWS